MYLTLFANALTIVLNSFFFRLQIYALMVVSEISEIILQDTLFFFFKDICFKFKRGKSKLFKVLSSFLAI